MKRWAKRIIKAVALTILGVLLCSGIALAAYTYYADIQVQETGGASYTYLPYSITVDNDYLADNGFITSTGLDTRVVSSDTDLQHLVVDDRLLFVLPSLGANSTVNSQYTLGNTAQSDFPIIVGYSSGYITISDDADLELGNNFEVEISAYVDTSSGSNKNLVYKEDAFILYVVDSTDIRAAIYEYQAGSGIWTTPASGSGTGWSNVSNAYDDNTGTYAEYTISPKSFSNYIYLDTDLYSDRVRYYVSRENSVVDAMYIDVYYDSSWNSILSGSFTTGAWTEVAVGSVEHITQARIRFYNNSVGSSYYARVHEFDFRANDVSESVTATAEEIANGEMEVKVTADGTNLKIYIDDVEEDSTALGGVSVPDNGTNWLIMQNNVMPYMEYYKHTVSSTLIAWYQPVTMIRGDSYSTGTATFTNGSTAVTGSGTTWTSDMDGSMIKSDTDNVWHVVSSVSDATHLTLTENYSSTGGSGHNYTMMPRLPDRQGALEDGQITWGSNPGSTSGTIGSLISTSQPTPSVWEEEDLPDIIPETDQPGWFDTDSLESNPLYPLVHILADASDDVTDDKGFTEWQIWLFMATMITLIAMAITYGWLRHMIITALVGTAAVGAFVALSIYPWWVLIIFAFIDFAVIVFERKPAI